MEKDRVAVLDSLRAAAALSVCFYHFVCTTTSYITNEFTLGVFSNGKYGVQMFFVISGFVIPMSMYKGNYSIRKMGTFFAKRLTRLEPPYLFSILLALSVLGARTFLGMPNDHMSFSLKQLGAHFMYLIPFFDDLRWFNQVYWTLAVEFQYYLIMALVYFLVVSDKLILRTIAYILFFSGFISKNSDFLPHWLPVFLLGILMFQYKFKIIRIVELLSVTALAVTGLIFTQPVAIVGFVLVTYLSILYFSNVKLPVLSYLGQSSYSIYLIHPIIGASTINLLSHHFMAWYQKPLVIGAGVLVTLFFSYLMHRFVERPSMNWSASLKYKDASN